jgi:CDP-diglyceride synthetase
MFEALMNFILFYCWPCVITSLVMLLAANGAPIIANKFFASRFDWPIDNKLTLSAGKRLFGDTKTWRGFFSAVLSSLILALLLGIEPLVGALLGALTMVGDLISSFIKRQLGRAESSRARGIDTLPETLLPLWLLKEPLMLGFIDVGMIAATFFLIEEYVSPILYKLHLRMRPY